MVLVRSVPPRLVRLIPLKQGLSFAFLLPRKVAISFKLGATFSNIYLSILDRMIN